MSSEQETPKRKRRFRVTRRGFLIGSGATIGALAVGAYFGRRPFYRYMAGTVDGASAPSSLTDDHTLWFEISPDNQVTLFIPKVEMGQGIHTSMAQIGAEELEIAWDQVNVVQSGTAFGPGAGFGTGGSTSIASSYTPLRKAGATMRELLKMAASTQLGVPVAELKAINGKVQVGDNNSQALTYGEIVAAIDSWPELDEDFEPTLKPISEHKVIGQSMPRVDFAAKLRGEAVYGYDLRTEGMLYGAAVHPPTINATMQAAEAGDAANAPGVVQVVIDVDKEFAGVVAKTRAQAQAAIDRLNITWDEGELINQSDIDAMLVVEGRDGVDIQKDGNVNRVLNGSAGTTISAEYRSPFAIHAHLEPQAAMADVQGDKAIVWASTQAQGLVRSEVAEALGIDAANVEVTPSYLGGGFGRRLNIKAANEAALLSQAVGKPVHVGWTRPDDMRQGYYRPPTRSVLTGTVDENGKILGIEHRQSSGEVAFPFFPAVLRYAFGSDFGSWRGSRNFYDNIENRSTIAYLADLPVRTGWWRSLGLLANIFATESFMDELAHEAGVDPLEFRLSHLADDAFGNRMKGVLNAVAEKSGWGTPVAAGKARGIACSPDVDTVVAMVAEISLSDNGMINVEKVTMAVDAGLFINPDGAIAQTQGNIVMGLSSTLIEEMTITNSVVRPRNFDTYPLITIDRIPEVEVILLESDGVPRGMGEPPLGPVAAAVGNALFALTGQRLRQLPLTPDRVLEAIA